MTCWLPRRAALVEYVDWMGEIHETTCPEDDTCSCHGKPVNARINAVLAETAPDKSGMAQKAAELKQRIRESKRAPHGARGGDAHDVGGASQGDGTANRQSAHAVTGDAHPQNAPSDG